MSPEMMAEIEKGLKEADEKVNAILTADQKKRVKEISIQLAKNSAILNEDIQKELGISKETVDKAKALQDGANKANGDVRTKMRDQEIDRADGQAIIEKNNKALEDELAKLLTPEQAAKLKAMGGAEFKAEPQQMRGFGGGGGL